MPTHSPRQVPLAVIALVLLAAVLMITVVPFITHNMLNPVISGQVARIEKFQSQGTPEGNTQAAVISIIPWTIGFLFPLWAALSFIGGFVLLAVALPLHRGEVWARGAALTALAMPAIGGAFMLVPWMNFVGSVQGGFPPAVLIMTIGLVPYFSIILSEKSSWMFKIANGLVFLMLGVSAAENFANAHAAFRIYFGHPKRPLFAEGIPVLWLAFPVLWITSFMLIVAIFKLGSRKVSGYYLALVAGGATFAASLATHYVRHATNDYLYGALMGLSIVALLVVPAIRKHLLVAGDEQPQEMTALPQPQAA
jgi:hypothetical protein